MHTLITLRPYGGLANRMRTIASGVQLSQDINKPLRVIWIDECNFVCPYEKIFKKTDYFMLCENPPLGSIRYPKYTQIYHNRLSKYISANKIGELFYDKYFYGPSTIPATDNINLLSCKAIYITSCHDFTKKFTLNKLFKPVKDIQDKIDEVQKKIGDDSIGVHIRRTDNVDAINSSPTQVFIERMKSLVDINAKTKFFLATDCKETENKLKQLFTNRIITSKKVLSRNSTKGIQDAVIDLYSLANTKMILGSSGSSFSTIASSLKNNSLDLITMKNE